MQSQTETEIPRDSQIVRCSDVFQTNWHIFPGQMGIFLCCLERDQFFSLFDYVDLIISLHAFSAEARF